MYGKDFYKNIEIIYSDYQFVLYEKDCNLHLDVWGASRKQPELTFTTNCTEYINNERLPYNDVGNILQFMSFCASRLKFPFTSAKLLGIALKIYNSNIE